MLSSEPTSCVLCAGGPSGRRGFAALLAADDWDTQLQRVRLCSRCNKAAADHLLDLARQSTRDLQRAHQLDPHNEHLLALLQQLQVAPNPTVAERAFQIDRKIAIEPELTRRHFDETTDAARALLGAEPPGAVALKIECLIACGVIAQVWHTSRCIGFWFAETPTGNGVMASIVALQRADLPRLVERLMLLGVMQFDAKCVEAFRQDRHQERIVNFEHRSGRAYVAIEAGVGTWQLRRPAFNVAG